MWVAERRENSEQYPKPYYPGVYAGLWWGVVTGVTVGYGDEVPKSSWGRCLGIMWMLYCLVTVSVFTGILSSVLTASQLLPPPSSLEDLRGQTVGVVRGGAGVEAARTEIADYVQYNTFNEGLSALLNGDVPIFLHDQTSFGVFNETKTVFLTGPGFGYLAWNYYLNTTLTSDRIALLTQLNDAILNIQQDPVYDALLLGHFNQTGNVQGVTPDVFTAGFIVVIVLGGLAFLWLLFLCCLAGKDHVRKKKLRQQPPQQAADAGVANR